MITIEKPLSLPDTYPLERIGNREEILFFDIETTGFSGDHSRLYLIGCSFYRNNCWHLRQWFADTPESEEDLLHAFFAFLNQFRILVHFNGDRFDIPYLKKRCFSLGLSCDFSGLKSIDIYQRIKPYRKLLGLDSLKQKSIEIFLGISRSDVCSGGELIAVYEEYLFTHKRHLYDLLILHNEDDLKGMPAILPILSYPDFLEHAFCLTSHKNRQETDENGETLHSLDLICESDYTIPVPFTAAKSPFRCYAEGSRLLLSIDLFDGTLKHFYPNYKDYYYLIYEDTAIHKSIGEYVDRNVRTKATARNCYTKKTGCFVPQPEPVWEPVMKKEPKDKIIYAALSDANLNDPEYFQRYLIQILKYLTN